MHSEFGGTRRSTRNISKEEWEPRLPLSKLLYGKKREDVCFNINILDVPRALYQ